MRKITKIALLFLFLSLALSDSCISHAVSPDPISASTTHLSGHAITHIVHTGDSLYGIARQYKVSIEVIQKLNHLLSDRIYIGQVLWIPSDNKSADHPSPNPTTVPPADSQPLPQFNPLVPNPVKNVFLTIDKSDHTLTIIIDGGDTKTYLVALGDGGSGDKTISGDHKTPEGEFYITEKEVIAPPDSTLGSRWIRLSYPNVEDANRGVREGIIDQSTHDEIVNAIVNHQTPPQYTALGSAVGIHGGLTPAKGLDWTWGSAALSNADIEELFDHVQIGTKVFIQK
ncbi:MAG TPA: L,D-transpeptidase family protein [Bacillota bacterium]|nr:L,D-transpeptidase family protein [Bacillota bacterium]